MNINDAYKIEKKQFFTFPAIEPVGEFLFEKLTTQNFGQLYMMFGNDDNIFTDERFKNYEGAKIYAEDREQYAAFSPKHAGQDWFFYWQDNIAGILHLYDLSLETFTGNNKRCWIGFAIKPELRNKGITKKVVQIFIDYIFKNYRFIEYIHAVVENDNKVSQCLLFSLNFKRDFAAGNSDAYHYYVCQKIN